MSRVSRKVLQPLKNTGSMVRASVGVGAALATILASAHSCGMLGGDLNRLSVAALSVTWIGLSPASDTALSLGDTLHYVATATDRRGVAILGVPLRWTSKDERIATVDSAGFVVARAAGAAEIIATVGEKSARARVVVAPRIARLEFGTDSFVRVRDGSTQQLTVRGVDARGNELGDLRNLAGWRSSDTSAASVSASGAVTARRPGRFRLYASIGDASDSALIEILPVPARIVTVSNREIREDAGATIPEPVQIRVESRQGHPMPGITVKLAAGGPGARVTPDSSVTDSAGIVSARWTLGDMPGRQRLTASVAGVAQPLVVEGEAEPVAANTRFALLGEVPRVPARSVVEVAVRTTDSLGRPLSDVPVFWSTAQAGVITPVTTRTDSAGEARATWALGKRSGSQRASVRLGHGRVAPFTVHALALPGSPSRLTLERKSPNEAAAGTTLPAIVVRVTDSAANPVPDVKLSVKTTGGTTPEGEIVTDSAGRATIRWTLGTKVGVQRMDVRAGKLRPVEIVVRGTAGSAANLQLTGPTSALQPGGKRLPIKATLTDVHGNPIGGRRVTLKASAGTIHPAQVVTGPDGTAASAWTVGRKAGVQALSATAGSVKQTLEVTVR